MFRSDTHDYLLLWLVHFVHAAIPTGWQEEMKIIILVKCTLCRR